LIGDFLALLRAAQPAKIETQRAYFKRHGMVISVDGMEPEQGNEMLFVVREANLDLTLIAETLYSSRADLISRHLLEPVKALGFRIRAVISDADPNIRRAVETSLPDCPHQACQVHCLCEAGAPIFEADRAMKTDMRRDLRAKLRPISRELSQASQDDLQTAVLMDYCEALRDALRADGISPFKLAGLKLHDELQRLEQSLRRCHKKKNIVSYLPCWNLRSFAISTWNLICN
jgi:5-methylcytosine-specific restriction endonuclease McrA